ncbi:hypothetical protein RDWZM_009943 [Blomia tropicalis]|uniref:Uncharacterized protein n=1 Tax=Blomia tropicalis TaxID=40697 RepID=A0A9Q0LYH6_BLOTA|nr:hypothetical protein RDWZM_009943 [Blomia tropicalis]
MSNRITPPIGIDIGSSNSCVAVWKNGSVKIISADQHHRTRTIPSYVGFYADGCVKIGQSAMEETLYNPTDGSTIFGIKRLIGKRTTNRSVMDAMDMYPFHIVDNDGFPNVEVEIDEVSKQFSLEQIMSIIMGKLKDMAETYLGEDVSDAVVTVPAYFNCEQRRMIIVSGKIAGLNIVRIINDSSAIALAYGFGFTSCGHEQNFLICDLGASKCEISIIQVKMNSFKNHHNDETDIDISEAIDAICILRTNVERAKRSLSSVRSVDIDIDELTDGNSLHVTITRDRFDDLCVELIEKIVEMVDDALVKAEMVQSSIDELIMVGGCSRIPIVRRKIQSYFDHIMNGSFNDDEVVAYGAAIQGAIIANVETSERLNEIVLEEIVSSTIGIEDLNGLMYPIIEYGTSIPCSIEAIVQPFNDASVSSIYIDIYEGDNKIATQNIFIGKFMFTDPVPERRDNGREHPMVWVKFRINKDELLKVWARDIHNNCFHLMGITANDGIHYSLEDIERLREETKYYLEQDRRKDDND